MKGRNVYLLIARDVTTDSSDGMNSILKIIDRFGGNLSKEDQKKGEELRKEGKFLAIPVPFSIASSWLLADKTSEDTQLKMIVNIFGPDGEDLGVQIQEHTVPAKIDRISMNLNSNALPITSSGKYTLHAQLFVNGQDTAIADADYFYEVELTYH